MASALKPDQLVPFRIEVIGAKIPDVVLDYRKAGASVRQNRR